MKLARSFTPELNGFSREWNARSIIELRSDMSLADELRQLLGNDAVADDPEVLAAHSGDKWFAAHEPEIVVFARSTSDVSKLLQFASAEKVPVTARGAGFGYVGGCVPARGGIALSLIRMNRINEINFADAIAIVEPGVITADLKAAAKAQKLLSAGPGEHEGLHDWWQRRNKRWRSAL